jgi:hypothetical protein
VEFGYDDGSDPESVAQRRTYWVEVEHCRWFDAKFKPVNWNLRNQLASIPRAFRHESDAQLIASLPK